MSFRRLVIGLSFLAVFTMAVRVAVDTDTWWHLSAGSWLLEKGEILRTDPFSLTKQGEPWIYPGWLAQAVLYGVFDTFGFAGLNLLTAIMVVIAFAFIWPLLDAPPLMRAFVLILAATVSAVFWSARPQIFSFTLSAIFLWSLTQAEAGHPRRLWILPLLMVFWSNLHGGFAIGFLLIGAYLLGEIVEFLLDIRFRPPIKMEVERDRKEKIRNFVIIGLVCAVAICINPHGPQMLLYPFKTVSVGVLQAHIEEWQSPNFHRLEVQPFLWMLMLSVVSLTLSRGRKRAVDLFIFIGFASLSLMAARNISTFALVAAPILARESYSVVKPLLEKQTPRPDFPEPIVRRVNIIIFVVLVFAALIKIAIPLTDQVNRDAVAGHVPVEAVAYLDEHPEFGSLFNSYNWGGYVVWALYPDYLSFVDGRTDLFGDEILEGYLNAWRAGPGWEGYLDRWGIGVVLLEPGAPLAIVLGHAGWELRYESEMAVVLTR
ncbi:MAG: hypothetical protein JSV37_04335 [Anaerolineaceae bacterium]|nr:MAG: hypothetical protein JSV37_04335 [Anaerolineaceae bacterium]